MTNLILGVKCSCCWSFAEALKHSSGNAQTFFIYLRPSPSRLFRAAPRSRWCGSPPVWRTCLSIHEGAACPEAGLNLKLFSAALNGEKCPHLLCMSYLHCRNVTSEDFMVYTDTFLSVKLKLKWLHCKVKFQTIFIVLCDYHSYNLVFTHFFVCIPEQRGGVKKTQANHHSLSWIYS